jgi:Family of unknown function (DUF5343)
MPEYPPYVNGYGGISKLFHKVKEAAVPPKFTQDFVSTVLDLKSSSYRAMIPLLKRLGFIDQANVPTQAYKDYRDDSQSGIVMAERLRHAYKALFGAHEYAYKLEKKDLQGKLKSLLGAADDDANIPYVAGTFLELAKLATWNGVAPTAKKEVTESREGTGGTTEREQRMEREEFQEGGFRIGYTINLNLPATTEIEVFNAIFKSLRENLLRHS